MTDRQQYIPGQPFYLSRLTDAEMAKLFAVTRLWFDAAPALSVSLGGNLRDEVTRRMLNTSSGTGQPPKGPEPLDLHFGQWSDRDVADAVRLLTVVSYVLTDAKVGELVDHLVASLAEVAAGRLTASGDPRNAAHYCERLQAEEGRRNDPERN